jgi:hypothetical protein
VKRIRCWYKNNLSDITILLSFLLICGLSLGLLAQVKDASTSRNKLSVSDFMLYIHPFLISGAINRIVDLMQTLSPQEIEQVLHQIIDTDEGSLTPEDKVKLIVHLGSLLHDTSTQHMVFEFLNQYGPLIESSQPMLYTLAQSKEYKKEIPAVLTWMSEQGSDKLARFVNQTLEFAVESNDIATFTALMFFAIPFEEKQAQQLLWRVVEQDKDPAFLDILKEYTSIDTQQGVHTPLMIAVEHRNPPLVAKLLALGSDPNKVVDNATGSALQISLIKQDEAGPGTSEYVTIEQLLREGGGRERTP